jgi:hypothetical protein
MPVILAIQEAGGSRVQGQPRQILQDHISKMKLKNQKGLWYGSSARHMEVPSLVSSSSK